MPVPPALVRHWPLFDLVVRTPELELRYPDEALLAGLLERIAEGIHEPGASPFGRAWAEVPSPAREWDALRWWWGCQSRWSVGEWWLSLVVLVDGEQVGVQDVRAKRFVPTRSVTTGSWLVRRAQGRGLGAEMRAAVLELAFAGLGAEEAHSSAFQMNTASIAVSRKLGYEPNGEELALRNGAVDRALCFRLPRERWAATRRDDIALIGLEPCLPLFGLGPGPGPASLDEDA